MHLFEVILDDVGNIYQRRGRLCFLLDLWPEEKPQRIHEIWQRLLDGPRMTDKGELKKQLDMLYQSAKQWCRDQFSEESDSLDTAWYVKVCHYLEAKLSRSLSQLGNLTRSEVMAYMQQLVISCYHCFADDEFKALQIISGYVLPGLRVLFLIQRFELLVELFSQLAIPDSKTTVQYLFGDIPRDQYLIDKKAVMAMKRCFHLKSGMKSKDLSEIFDGLVFLVNCHLCALSLMEFQDCGRKDELLSLFRMRNKVAKLNKFFERLIDVDFAVQKTDVDAQKKALSVYW